MFLSPSPVAQNYKLQHVRLVIPFSITGNATPASKVISYGELQSIMYVRSEGLTAVVDAIESTSTTNFAAPDDNNTGDSVFNIFIKGPNGLGKIKKLLKASISEDGTSLATSLAITKKGDSSSGVSVDNNICLDVAGTGLNLASESPSLLLEIECMVE